MANEMNEIRSVTEIKLNEWRWGVVPELDPEATLAISLRGKHQSPNCTWHSAKRGDLACAGPIWYAVLSLGRPAMPEPELRLPDGWVPSSRYEEDNGDWFMSVNSATGGPTDKTYTRIAVRGKTRRECVEEINRILGGGK